jgi:hypothetical protein
METYFLKRPGCVPFIVSPIMTALSHINPASAWTSSVTCCAQGHHQRTLCVCESVCVCVCVICLLTLWRHNDSKSLVDKIETLSPFNKKFCSRRRECCICLYEIYVMRCNRKHTFRISSFLSTETSWWRLFNRQYSLFRFCGFPEVIQANSGIACVLH